MREDISASSVVWGESFLSDMLWSLSTVNSIVVVVVVSLSYVDRNISLPGLEKSEPLALNVLQSAESARMQFDVLLTCWSDELF